VARNVEIKATVDDFAPVVRAVEPIAAGAPALIVQEDTFFRCGHGRLKLRKFSATSGELIHYERADQTGPKESRYTKAATSEPDRLRDALAAANGTIGVVRKRRTLYIVGRTRVHLDDVDGLGKFVELEVALDDGESTDAGITEARRLMTTLGIAQDRLVSHAYLDLLTR